jgi:hypothetical protein
VGGFVEGGAYYGTACLVSFGGSQAMFLACKRERGHELWEIASRAFILCYIFTADTTQFAGMHFEIGQ